MRRKIVKVERIEGDVQHAFFVLDCGHKVRRKYSSRQRHAICGFCEAQFE